MANKKPEYTQPRTQTDLEARLADEPPAASVVVNPNPFGDEAYAGTDPIYQNYANDTEKPLRAAKGVEKKAEDQIREAHKFADDADVVDDHGLGGKAARANVASSATVEPEPEPAPEEPDTSGGGNPSVPPPAPQVQTPAQPANPDNNGENQA